MTLTRWVARPLLASVFVSSGFDTLRNPASKVETAEPLSIGRFPRLAALALAGSIVPTTLAGHRFWEADDPSTKAQQQVQFMKNLGLLGGLLLAAVDTGGAPSLSWRARRAARRARHAASSVVEHLPVG